MQIHRTAGALGAEISGIDVARGVSARLAADVRAVWLQHQVVFLRDQTLSVRQFLDFAKTFGVPVEYPFVKGVAGFPQVIEVKKLPHERHNFGGVWHSDTTYLPEPPMGSMLLALQVPPFGGDTLFASQYAAYEGLSGTLQRLQTGLVGISSSAKADVSKTREDRIQSDGKPTSPGTAPSSFRAEHPLVRTHPETGRKSLYLNVAHTTGIVGLRDEESAPLLQFLFAHQVKPEFTCRFVWRTGSIAFWDNRCTLHNPVNDYQGHLRLMHRITLQGDRPV